MSKTPPPSANAPDDLPSNEHLSEEEQLDREISLQGNPSPKESDPGSMSSSGVLDRLRESSRERRRYSPGTEIARGGMGAILEVWDKDLRRKLAMKVALDRSGKSGSSSANDLDPRVLSRFLEEAQVTGQLEHPGIVPVHELGINESGEAYFTMRLVRGRDLEAIFDLVDGNKEGWSVTRALSVLLKVCDAMAFAHSKGVVHRDLKPANVMVGHFGEVYVMDWGLVRIRGHEDSHDLRVSSEERPADESVHTDRREDASGESGEELYTMDGDVIGTPAYMSPEQARGRLAELDERTDVYAIGAMLYRVLSGKAPYAHGVEKRGAAAVLRDLLEGPPTPLVGAAHHAPAELIAICEKAMAREASARYPDVQGLAEDLRAFLENRVVQAYEAGAIAEARKWVVRNKPLAGALAACVVALIGGLVASVVLKGRSDANAVLAEERRIDAEESAVSATRQARIAEEINRFLNDDVFAAIAPEHLGIDVSMREVLDVACFRLMGRFEEEPLVEAALNLTMGISYERLGEYETALTHLERSYNLRESTLGENAAPTLEAMRETASVLASLNQTERALELYEAALERSRASGGEADRTTLSILDGIGVAYSDQGRFEEAREIYEQVLDLELENFGNEDATTLATMGNLGLVLEELGEFEESEVLLREVLATQRRLNGSRHPTTLNALTNLAETLFERGQLEESEGLQREAHEARVEVLGPKHPSTGVGLSNLGALLVQTGRNAEAKAFLEEGRPILIEALGEEHPLTLLATNNLAVSYSRLGLYEEALEMRKEGLEMQRAILGPKHPDTLITMGNLAILYREMDRIEESEVLQREVVELRIEVLGPDHPATLISRENFAGLLFYKGDLDGALKKTREVLEARRRVLGEEHPDVGKTVYNMAMIAEAGDQDEDAKRMFEEALAINRAAVGEVHQNVAECLMSLGDLELKLDHYTEAERLLEKAIETFRKLGPDNDRTGYLLHQWTYAAYMKKEYTDAIARGTDAVSVRRSLLGIEDSATLITLYVLAKSHFKAGQYAESEPLVQEYHDVNLRLNGPGSITVGHGRKLLRELYEAWGKPEEAAKYPSDE